MVFMIKNIFNKATLNVEIRPGVFKISQMAKTQGNNNPPEDKNSQFGCQGQNKISKKCVL
jgi:hypothetical protein